MNKTDLKTPWVEKYRPKTFNEIVSQSIAIDNLKDFVKSGEDMPHMIFSGPAGTGKTSTALIISSKLIPQEDYYQNVLELNASDTVRMDFVRKELQDFVQQNMIIGNESQKLVILDEADNIPKTVQQTLRRIIEGSPNKVKFILMCNYIDQIIDPIISRCAVFRFVKLPEDKIVKRLKYIAKQENLSIAKDKEEEFFKTLFFISEGDLRKAINTLQMSVALELLEDLNINEILKISGFVEEPVVESLIKSFNHLDFTQSREILHKIDIFDSRNFIRQISENISQVDNLTTLKETKIRAMLGDVDFYVSQGADKRIQILALLANLIDFLKNN
ncbi:MAG: Replication factor C small subunit [Promethearchaeota archaeon]|nr:MAG: Replication factor C small subunit [Candidatus Lokiarchaeota archaeon]